MKWMVQRPHTEFNEYRSQFSGKKGDEDGRAGDRTYSSLPIT